MRRIRTTFRVLVGAAVAAGGMAAFVPAAHAITIPVACGENNLVAAVDLANSTAAAAADTLVLAGGCTYTLTRPHGGPNNGLPVITTPIEMIGPATITRSSSRQFRIVQVDDNGSLTLTTAVSITNGSVVGNGGGILNHGAVTLTGSFLSGNTATLNGGGLANIDTTAGADPAATFTNSPVSDNTSLLRGGGLYNGRRGTLTATGVTGNPMIISGNTGSEGGGIAAVSSTATTLTDVAVTSNVALVTAGGVLRIGGTMTTTNSPITANVPNNCVGSVPAVPNCTG